MKSIERAKKIIFEQKAPLAVRRSAWRLYQHEINRINPATSRLFTPQKALSNILRWIAERQSRRRRLTPTQMQIVHLLAREGLNQKQIAGRLKRRERTIKMHFARMREQLGVDSMYQVVAVAVQRGWIKAPKLED